jgi:hypothetical protein
MAQKTFFCHSCRDNFRKMVNVNLEEEVCCTRCGNEFCEEVNSIENPLHFYEAPRTNTAEQSGEVTVRQES